MSVQNLVNKAIDETNKNAERNTENTVRVLVDKILCCEAEIARIQRAVAEYKEQLKSLEMPVPVSLDL